MDLAWVLTPIQTYVWVDDLHAGCHLRAFDPRHCDAPAIRTCIPWCRLDLRVDRPHYRGTKLFYQVYEVQISHDSLLHRCLLTLLCSIPR